MVVLDLPRESARRCRISRQLTLGIVSAPQNLNVLRRHGWRAVPLRQDGPFRMRWTGDEHADRSWVHLQMLRFHDGQTDPARRDTASELAMREYQDISG
jgi:hypothetical protein